MSHSPALMAMIAVRSAVAPVAHAIRALVAGVRPEVDDPVVELGIDRGAAQLHDHGLAAEALDIGQGLDEDPGGVGGAHHDVTESSLM